MDDPALPASEHLHALAGLARLNRAARADRLTWPAVRWAAERAARDGRGARVLDVACGAGDAIAGLAARARRTGARVEWTACDMSRVALDEAVEHDAPVLAEADLFVDAAELVGDGVVDAAVGLAAKARRLAETWQRSEMLRTFSGREALAPVKRPL
jgi:SAM-dependent methyltransferase